MELYYKILKMWNGGTNALIGKGILYGSAQI
jgi:hypothetical protein